MQKRFAEAEVRMGSLRRNKRIRDVPKVRSSKLLEVPKRASQVL